MGPLVSAAWPCADTAVVSYPIPGAPIADYDVNCNFNVTYTPGYWYPRQYNMSLWDNSSLPDSVRALQVDVSSLDVRGWDSTRLVYSQAFDGGSKVQLPIDISPSTLPDCTVEMLVVAPVGSGSAWLALWSAELAASAQDNVVHARSLLTYEDSSTGGSGSVLVPLGPTPLSHVHTSSGTGSWTHVAVVYKGDPNSSAGDGITWIVNGHFSGTRTAQQADGDTQLTLGGVWGRSDNDGGGTVVYLRVWDRALNASEVQLLSDAALQPYAAPVVTQSLPVLLDNSLSPDAPVFLISNVDAQQPSWAVTRWNTTYLDLLNSTTGEVIGGDTTNVVFYEVHGNATFGLQFYNSLYPSSSYASRPHTPTSSLYPPADTPFPPSC